jgi:two-component system sensor histidine kinase/response regulator
VEGDWNLVAELVEMFGTDSRRLVADVRRCLEAGDARGVAEASHALKGSAGQMGGHAAASAASALELMARSGALSGGGERLAELEREVDRLRSGLSRMCEDKRAPPVETT